MSRKGRKAAPAISARTLISWGRYAALSRHKAAPTTVRRQVGYWGNPPLPLLHSNALWRIVAIYPVARPLYSLLQTQLARSLLKAARVYTTTG